jgi:hypothetical protein
MWMEVVMVLLKIIPWHLPGGTKENHKKSVRITALWADLNQRLLHIKQGC